MIYYCSAGAKKNRESIRALLDGGDMQLSVVDDMNKLRMQVTARPIDCLVLDLSEVEGVDLNALERICAARDFSDFPVIVYGEDSLGADAEAVLARCENACGENLLLRSCLVNQSLLRSTRIWPDFSKIFVK